MFGKRLTALYEYSHFLEARVERVWGRLKADVKAEEKKMNKVSRMAKTGIRLPPLKRKGA